MSQFATRPVEVLLVDDSEQEVFLLRRVLNDLPMPQNTHWVENGPSALDYVNQRAPYEDAVRPDLILLDLNMPGMSGHQVLQALKTDEQHKSIPIVIMTNSDQREDIRESFDQYCNGYLNKPFSYADLKATVSALSNFWFSTVLLPSQPADVQGKPSSSEQLAFETDGCDARILLVEDDPIDTLSVINASKELGFAHPIETKSTAESALEYLRNTNTPPSLILLDLKLPGASGQTLLSQLKEDANLRSIQVVALTAFSQGERTNQMYHSHAGAVVAKPNKPSNYKNVLASIALWHSFSHHKHRPH